MKHHNKLSILTALLSAFSSVQAGGAQNSCSIEIMDNSVVAAWCSDGTGNGEDVYNQFDLNDCFVNQNGNIELQPNGQFGLTCTHEGDPNDLCWSCGTGNNGPYVTACPDFSEWHRISDFCRKSEAGSYMHVAAIVLVRCVAHR
jgi:hypothetical protein